VIRVALRGLAGRKLRAALTAFAVVLGVAMVSGSFVLTDTINKAFNNIFSESYANTDAVVSGKSADIDFQGDTAETPAIPADLLQKVRALPDVATATGSVVDQDNADILKKNGKAVETGGAPSFGWGIDPAQGQFNPLKLLDGRWAQGSDEVVIDASTADEQGYKIGDAVKIATLQPVQQFKIVGLAQYGDVNSLGSATFAVFTIPTAQSLFDRVGKFDAIQVAGNEGVTPQQLVSEIQPILPATAQVRTGEQEADKQAEDVSFTKFIQYFLLAFAGIALFVGAFVIFNTLSITVAQRTRELATIRTIGGSRRQVLWSVMLEAFVIGVVAAVTGLFGGLGLAWLLNLVFKAFNADFPSQGIVFAPRTIVVALLIGVVVTVLAGLVPAIRATRVPPIAAVREGFVLPRGRIARFAPYIALVVIGIAVLLLAYSMFKDDLGTVPRLLAMGVGVLLLFIGVAMISSRLVRPLAAGLNPIGKWVVAGISTIFYPVTVAYWYMRRGAFEGTLGAGRRVASFAGGALIALVGGAAIAVLGYLVTQSGVAGVTILGIFLLAAGVAGGLGAVLGVAIVAARAKFTSFQPEWPAEFPAVRPEQTATAVARENARRNPGRTASTAAALMIGIALVTFVAVLGNGLKASNRGAIEDQVKAEYVLTSQDGFTPFVSAAGEAISRSPSAQFVTSVRSDLGKADGDSGYITGIEPGAIALAYSFDWQKGSDDVLASLGRNGAIISDDFADKKNLDVGDMFKLLTPSAKTAQLVVKGIYKPPPFFPLLGSVSISKIEFDSLYERPRNSFVFVNVPGDPSAATTASLERAVKDFPDAKVQTRVGWIEQQDEDANNFLQLLYILLALSVIVSIFGMINTAVLSVFERTRELGMLRAVGMTRRQVRRMVRHESVITALIGAALGLPLGVFLALLVTKALSQFEVQIAVPGGQLLVFAVVAGIVGIFAAILPARRAARLNILQALQYE
jgi:putative ABC transport system permease protein